MLVRQLDTQRSALAKAFLPYTRTPFDQHTGKFDYAAAKAAKKAKQAAATGKKMARHRPPLGHARLAGTCG